MQPTEERTPHRVRRIRTQGRNDLGDQATEAESWGHMRGEAGGSAVR